MLASLALIMILLFIGIIVFFIIAFWKIFTKAGEEGWKVLIPVYNLAILLKIVGKPLWWMIFFLVPFCFSGINTVNTFSAMQSGDVYAPSTTFTVLMVCFAICSLVFHVWMYNMLSKSFGKDEGFTAGLVILGFIFIPILAFGDARYLGPYGNRERFQRYQEKENSSFDFENDVYQNNKPSF